MIQIHYLILLSIDPCPLLTNECINYEETPLNRLSPVASEEEVFDNEELGLTAPLTPNEIADFAEAAVTATTEKHYE